MAESTITAKGQTTVPADTGALVDAKPGTRLVCSASRGHPHRQGEEQVDPRHGRHAQSAQGKARQHRR